MDILNAYGSDASDSDEQPQPTRVVRHYKVDTAPDVAAPTTDLAGYLRHDQHELHYNVPHSILSQPLVGPTDALLLGSTRHKTSQVDSQQAVNETMFREQERMLRQQGTTTDPVTGAPVHTQAMQEPANRGQQNNRSLRRKAKGKVGVVTGDDAYVGPWAGYDTDTKGKAHGPTAEQLAEYEARLADSGAANENAASGSNKTAATSKRMLFSEGQTERSTFHGTSERDYQGRTFMHPPTDLRPTASPTCFPPKRLVRDWRNAHTGGVSAIRFLPDTGHLLLSCGMDGLVKIYDTHKSHSLLRTYIGHSKAVRDISFAPDGRSFLSSSYDKHTKLWDTETGQCTQVFGSGQTTPYVARFFPEDPNLLLVGQGDRKITQWDIREGNKSVQEYNQHLGAINSITFVDNNRRFISSSDDKSLRAWEFGIPVVIKLIADPAMHSVPAVVAHPAGKWIAGQSMDNRIVVVNVAEKIKLNRKKSFAGHLTAGYACQPAISHDGKYVVSGDAEGSVWCWDWKSARVVEKWKAHDNVTIGCEWHPCESSKVATCSWDGSIKYWD